MKSKGAQMKLSFGMIFSIILIIIFLAFAFYAIQQFFSFQGQVTTSKFYDSLRKDVDEVWKASQASKAVGYLVPSGVSQVCFNDDSFENVVLYKERSSVGQYVDHLEITQSICITAVDGRVKFLLVKNYSDALVKVERQNE
ncbi:MAG: hypothetical protein KKB62_03725 [Nanoarchaeota archaeon]|jgi:uncharacterized protein (UPF0333 family)|nr:hypothetical protein [Nanoarchaeota archaeon]